MIWFEILLCNYQPMPFMVEADNHSEAVEKTLLWAMKKYPGMFTDVHGVSKLNTPGFPLISEVIKWD